MEGRVVKAHVLAVFTCDRCGGDCQRLTIAPVVDGRIIEPAERPATVICNACQQAEVDVDEADRKARAEQKKWANGVLHSPYAPKPSHRRK